MSLQCKGSFTGFSAEKSWEMLRYFLTFRRFTELCAKMIFRLVRVDVRRQNDPSTDDITRTRNAWLILAGRAEVIPEYN